MLNGWVSLDRAMLDHWCASDPLVLAVWVRLLLEANHADKKRMFNGVLMEVKRGQLVFGYPAFAKKSGVTVNQLRRIIGQLETDNMIHRQKTNKFSLISITNYDEYQKDHRQNTGKTQADHSQSTGKPQHLNNGNKVNNENNTDIPAPAKPDADCVMPDQVMALYNEILGDLLPSCRAMSKNRKSSLRARIKEDGKRRDPDWWRRYFEHIAESSWLTGQTPGANGQVFGGADMGWILNGENMLKIIEGKYHREA